MSYSSGVLFSIDTAMALRGGVNAETITSHKVVSYQSSTYQIITNNTAGALEVRLPGANAGSGEKLPNGGVYFIRSVGSQALTIQGESGATKATLATNESGLFACDGTNWFLVFKAS